MEHDEPADDIAVSWCTMSRDIAHLILVHCTLTDLLALNVTERRMGAITKEVLCSEEWLAVAENVAAMTLRGWIATPRNSDHLLFPFWVRFASPLWGADLC